jgi:hypothetical protein
MDNGVAASSTRLMEFSNGLKIGVSSRNITPNNKSTKINSNFSIIVVI